jgi:Family of unknown function (DUF6353)
MGLSGLALIVQRGKFLLNENSTTILTSVGVVGTGATAYLTGRATFKAAELIAQKERDVIAAEVAQDFPEGMSKNLELTRFDKVRVVWRQYIPPVVSGLATVAAIVGANRIASRKIAALTVAAGLSERALQEYKAKVIERIGRRDHEKIRDAVAQDRVNRNPVDSQEVIIVGTGEALFYDNATGRYFQSTMENVKKAANKVNFEIVHYMNASLSQFYDEIGLPATAYTDSVGFNSDHLLELDFSATISTDGRPCIVIDFVNPPISGFSRFDYT